MEVWKLSDLCLLQIASQERTIQQSDDAPAAIAKLPSDIKSKLWSLVVERGWITPRLLPYLLPANTRELHLGSVPYAVTPEALRDIGTLYPMKENLTSINLCGCTLVDDQSFSVLVTSCPNLTQLNLTGLIKLTSVSIEALVANCPNLTELDLTDCIRMDDSAFYQITLLPKLAILNLADCHRITWDFNKTEYATYFKALKKESLRSICLRSIATLDDLALYKILAMFPCLQILDLSFSNGRITNVGVDSIAASACSSSLFALNLWGSSVTDHSMKFLAERCTNIKSLTISDCKALTEESILYIISRMKKLRTLNMWGCSKISAASIQLLLRYFTSLLGLGLSYCDHIMDYSLIGLDKSNELKSLELDYCINITDAGISPLGGTNLVAVNLRCCVSVTFAGVQSVLQKSPNITTLNLGKVKLSSAELIQCFSYLNHLSRIYLADCGGVSDEVILFIAQKYSSTLQSIKLDYCKKIGDQSISLLLRSCSRLSELSVIFCTQLSDKAFDLTGSIFDQSQPYSSCLALQSIYLSGCDNFSSKAVMELITRSPLLRTLSIAHVSINDDTLIRLPRYCLILEHLNIAMCKAVTPKGVAEFVKGCPHLKHLDLSFTKAVNDSVLLTIARYSHGLKYLDISNTSTFNEDSLIEVVESCLSLQRLRLNNLENCVNLAERIKHRPYLTT